MTARTRKAATAPEVTAEPEITPEPVPATTVNRKRAAIIARIKATVGTVSKGSASLLTDTLALTDGIKAEDFADVLMPEIGSFRIGRVLTRKDNATLIKAL